VRFKDVSFKDLSLRVISPERSSTRFRMQQLEEFSYGWGAASADFNRDGNLDVTAGPYIYYGPDFTKRREIYLGTVAPGYPQNMVTHAFDFTGDGWADVLATESRPMVLYVNRKVKPVVGTLPVSRRERKMARSTSSATARGDFQTQGAMSAPTTRRTRQP
jgi:hypothetical protein